MKPAGEIRIGISGWRYKGWRGTFYPAKLAQRLELEYAANHFNSIELNGSFYSLQRPASFAQWRDATPRQHSARVADLAFGFAGEVRPQVRIRARDRRPGRKVHGP